MYSLEALLARHERLTPALELFPQATLVGLPQNMAMIPVDGFLLRDLEIHYQGGTHVTDPRTHQFSPPVHPHFERLIVGVEMLAQELSKDGLVAYLEATFTSGYGGHATMLWDGGERLGEPGDSINEVLHRLGVVAEDGLDAFDTMGLGRHRSTRQWVQDRLD